jgi:hypothetical protein
MSARRLLPTFLVAAVAMTTACGNYDPETRLFRELAPRIEDVALEAPGASTFAAEDGGSANTETQGMAVVCNEDRLRCHAQNIATLFNGISFGLLWMVDLIIQFPPSSREPGKRVWGPHYQQREDRTIRFEMVREADDSFSYCLHAGFGDLSKSDFTGISCADVEHAAGVVRLLSGNVTPGDAEGAAVRSGAGTLVFEPINVELLDEPADAPLTFTVGYDNTDGHDIRVDIDSQVEETCNPILETDTYRYTRDLDGAGTFRFKTNAEFVPGDFGFDNVCEELTITAQWQDDRAGRADALICGGNLGEACADAQVSATECWDDELTTVFADNSLPDSQTEGDVSDCVFAQPLP